MSQNFTEITDFAQKLRRSLHQNPELSWHEIETAERVRRELDALGLTWRECAETGTIATIDAPNRTENTPHIALRADIDALPITEQSGREWSSNNSGCMHACGHDGHTATLMGAAHWLKTNQDKLPAPVTLLFQPAEEGGHGAKRMIENGALEGIDYIFGWHNWPAISFGQMVCPDGIVMCGNGTFKITINGKGGHASQPELCADPLLAASAINLSLQQIVSRKVAPQAAAVVSITSITCDSNSPTVIPQQAVLQGSIRVPDDDTREILNHSITDISKSTAKAYGVECTVDIYPRYNATVNHAECARLMRSAWQQEFGEQALDNSTRVPIMASEDFSYYLREIPGAFALIGANDGAKQHSAPCHSPFYDFNDKLIPLVCRLFARLCGVAIP
ncbi:N(2)-acetyl-L-2,4-diaminobutanoate deacetylase DoeB2 [Catenovulum sediminis]|uniref:N(2)-acetyl-L-2,4-diaminobutanoate deacetylase DoeB2 n=1 Tax=Catenovulum sediminis TaxID=1740262 RepID=UPI0011813375|nr:N(2)-acetyl-L-2,4-diaminobutanoate deacetylase DoeB2 [Catenovulum sediminis]